MGGLPYSHDRRASADEQGIEADEYHDQDGRRAARQQRRGQGVRQGDVDGDVEALDCKANGM